MASARPNILIVMTDQHNKSFMGCAGNTIVRTPNLDRLAQDGMRFTDAYCAAPLCVPSRMSFMTCRTPSRNRVWDNNHILSSSIPTWAHAMGVADYETALIGRMHFVGSDHRHGFERRPMGEYSARHPGTPEIGGRRFVRIPSGTSGQMRKAVECAGSGSTSYQWFDRHVAQAACGYLREHADSPDRPFVAVAGMLLPHCPFVAPKELFDYYRERVDVPEAHPVPPTVRRFQEHRGLVDPPLDGERIRVARAAYYALCEQMDREVGRILDCLDETGLSQNTMVIYCSDHGEMAGEHGCWWKSNFYEGSAGVPLIVRWQGHTPAGRVCRSVVNLMDIGVTCADLAGQPWGENTDGRSLLPLLSGGEAPAWRQETFSEFVDMKHNHVLPCRMIRSGKWKLWQYVDEAGLPPALFDLEKDPDERVDLAGESEFADVRRDLELRLLDGWDPEWAGRESREGIRNFQEIREWGKAVGPDCADTFPVPPAELEDDIELL